MSGIAGIIHFDGRPVEPGQIEAMTTAMAHRGPDGIHHWRQGDAALGECLLCTTPESLEETLPLTNEDASLVLVMDGRVDNADALRQELLGRGAQLRTRADAELVLRAYEAWGEACVHHIVGECVFFVWNARERTLFAARDAAGARHFYFHAGPGWLGFASEIKGLLTLPHIERRLNESRMLDYLLPQFDRDDEVGTFWLGVSRLPAGHAMRVTATGLRTWRWWDPRELEPLHFASLAECTDAFMAELRRAVRCRLRSIKPVGAMLSGGLDSSTIVALISKDFRDQLAAPLRTVSLIRQDRHNCPDWQSIDAILKTDSWLKACVVDSAQATDHWEQLMQAVAEADEPFAFSHGLTYHITYRAAREVGCGVLLDGMAGDLHFYDPGRSVYEQMVRHRFGSLPSVLASYSLHGLKGGVAKTMRMLAGLWAPAPLKHWVGTARLERLLRSSTLKGLDPQLVRDYLARKSSEWPASIPTGQGRNDQSVHGTRFTQGTASFAHETYGLLAFAQGVEPRSPYSDRRLMEFSVRMPLEAKLANPWYKHVLRHGSAGLLPDAVRWRTEIGGHPGGDFYTVFGNRLLCEPLPGNARAIAGALGSEEPGRTPLYAPESFNSVCMRLLADWKTRHIPPG